MEIIALFGESQRGAFQFPYYFESIPTLLETLGTAPPESKGLPLAIQTLHYRYPLLFFRVREEGYSVQDYFEGLWILRKEVAKRPLYAVGIPGVGSAEIIDPYGAYCQERSSVLLLTESDLYDYLVA